MNPLLQEALASVVRHVLTIGAGALVSRGIWTEQAAMAYVAAAAVAAVGVGWSVWQKYVSRSKLVTALASPKGMTEREVERLVANPAIDTPSPTLLKDESAFIPRPIGKGAP